MQTEEYKQYRKLFTAGLCPSCGAKLINVSEKAKNNGEIIHFKCTTEHSHYEAVCKESIKVWDMLRLEKNGKGKKAELKIKKGHEKSGDSRYPKGVKKYMKVDRINNQYDQIIQDLNTGKIIHEEHESLDQHKS